MRNRRRTTARTGCGCSAEVLEARIVLSVFTVSNSSDSGAGSLRQAILDANNTTGADTIVFDASFSSSAHTITFTTPTPQINGQLTITGPGASLLTVTRSGPVSASSNVFNSFASSLTMTGMTVSGGNINANGGGLSISGVAPNVLLDAMVFTGNNTSGNGGGISLSNSATLTIRNSVVSDNTATGLGGGIFFFQNGSLVVQNCTISGNSSGGSSSHDVGGGGIYFEGNALTAPPAGFTPGTLLVQNSTIDHNTATHGGGGIGLDGFIGTLLVQNTTIAGNTAGTSGGGICCNGGQGAITLQDSTVFVNGASGTTQGIGGGGVERASTLTGLISLTNSVVSGNTNANAPDILADAFTSTTANFSAIGKATGFAPSGSSGSNLPFDTDLHLDALANRGGATQTMLPLANSPLLDAGSNGLIPSGLSTDQRGAGFARISGGIVDIGAAERNPSDTSPLSITAGFFRYITGPQAVLITYNESIFTSFGDGNLHLRNLTTATDIATSDVAATYYVNNVEEFTFFNYRGNVLPDGNYLATIPADAVWDSAGHHLNEDFTLEFFVLAGDANHDRHVDVTDLGILATNWQGSGKIFAEGDFNYDGVVDVTDLGILATNWQKSLSVPSASLSAARAANLPGVVASSSIRHPARMSLVQDVLS